MNCGKIAPPCTNKQHRCHDNSKCIPMNWVCDGNPDCKDKSDEVAGCVRKGDYHFRYFIKHGLELTPIIGCCCSVAPCTGFLCTENKACIPSEWICDGSEDCEGGSDEANCSGTEHLHCMEKDLRFFCNDKSVCLDKELVCNGVHNCKDASDEGGQCGKKILTLVLSCLQRVDNGCLLDERTCDKASCAQSCFQTPRSAVCYCATGYQANGSLCLGKKLYF